MNYKVIGHIIAMILLIEAGMMLPSVFISAYDGDIVGCHAFLVSMGIIVLVALLLRTLCRSKLREFYAKEGLACVGLAWIAISLAGCLPLVFSGQIPRFIDAFFEMVSGFTTTGASILPDVESLSRGMLYWRSFSHWIGGMGVLVFLLAFIPVSSSSGGFAVHLLRAESPGPSVGKLVPRIRNTAVILYFIYIFLTIFCLLSFLLGGMPLFDALCLSFGTAGTGGFGIYNSSMAGYSPHIQVICTVFMMLFGINFSCYYLILLRNFCGLFRDEELRVYLGVFAGAVMLIAWNLRGFYETVGETFRHAAFQVASIITTTGYATVDFDGWPAFSKAILLLLMIIGASAGSTGGGLKCARVLILGKGFLRQNRQIQAPKNVQVLRINGRAVSDDLVNSTTMYLAVYVFIMAVSYLVISLDGHSVSTNISAVFSCFNNIGPGLDVVGPTGNYSSYSDLSKLVLIFDMLAGRLEIYPVLALFIGRTWRHR